MERAEKLLQKGKTADALEEYLLVLRDDTENDVVRQLAADLCLSLSRNADAVKLLGDLFERQVGAGDATRASLTYKKLARHGSPTWQQKFRFGQLLEGSNKKLAVGTYEAALTDLGKLGQEEGSGGDIGSHRHAGADAGEFAASGGTGVGAGESEGRGIVVSTDRAVGRGRGWRRGAVVRARVSGRCFGSEHRAGLWEEFAGAGAGGRGHLYS